MTKAFEYAMERRSDYPDIDTKGRVIGSPADDVYGKIVFNRPLDAAPTFGITPLALRDSRLWLTARPANWLIQIQSDRFIMNWRKIASDDSYPRYGANLRPRFIQEWEKFQNFVKTANLGPISPTSWEIVYVNDLVYGQDWARVSDANSYFSFLRPLPDGAFLPDQESLGVSGSFNISGIEGRLNFTISHLKRMLDDAEVVQFQLVARGKPLSAIPGEIMTSVDIGREWIVRGFSDLTTEGAHNLWGRTQ